MAVEQHREGVRTLAGIESLGLPAPRGGRSNPFVDPTETTSGFVDRLS
jgi:hypothetical protein